MAKKVAPDSAPNRGLNDIIGIVLMGSAILLLIALLSYDAHDRPENHLPANHPVHNWIGPIGSWIAYEWLLGVGVSAYVLPFILMFVGLGCFFEAMAYLRRRWVWSVVLFICCIGLLALYDSHLATLHARLQVSAGGIFGTLLNQYIFNNFGLAGATIIFLMLGFISCLFLTNFQLGDWVRALWVRKAEVPAHVLANGGLSDREVSLEKRKRELEKQLREQGEKTSPSPATSNSGLGADGKPLPEPMVRDLSVPQAKAVTGRAKKTAVTEPPVEIAPAEEGVVIPAREVAAATSSDILGKKPAPVVKTAEPKAEEPKPTEDAAVEKIEKPCGRARRTGGGNRACRRARRRQSQARAASPQAHRRGLHADDRQLSVAARWIFSSIPDMTVKPTESKEELMANARLMQQTLAQFDIEVSLGDITKGPTITRYELHPAPGVKLEKITALSNNIAAALKAERINILAPVPGKSSVGVEVPNADQDQSHHARPVRIRRMAQHQGAHSARAGQGCLRPSDHRRPRGNAALAHRRQHRFRQIRLHQFHHRVAALPIFAGPIALRDDRSEGGRIAAIQRAAASGRAGRDRSRRK